jgi:hypothetical protein
MNIMNEFWTKIISTRTGITILERHDVSMICAPCRNQNHTKCITVAKGDETWCDCQHRQQILPLIEDPFLPAEDDIK